MRSWGWKRWLVILPIAAVVTVVGGTWVYLNVIQEPAPERLALSEPSSTGEATGASIDAATDPDGEWRIADGSVVGYRVEEVLFGQHSEAVGRTEAVTGSITVTGTTIPASEFSVDMTAVTSDESRRDTQFHGRIMETARYPTASFTLTEPIELGSIPDEDVEETFEATGDLTLHGVTRSVTFETTGRWTGSTIQIVGSIPVTFADYGIGNPSFAGVVTTEDHGTLEFLLNLER
jgi:polyisoprenoid-binding protein YceI